jgi:hypothetical protein
MNMRTRVGAVRNVLGNVMKTMMTAREPTSVANTAIYDVTIAAVERDTVVDGSRSTAKLVVCEQAHVTATAERLCTVHPSPLHDTLAKSQYTHRTRDTSAAVRLPLNSTVISRGSAAPANDTLSSANPTDVTDDTSIPVVAVPAASLDSSDAFAIFAMCTCVHADSVPR